MDAAGRARIAQARRSSIAALERELRGDVPSDRALGTPDGDGQLRLLAALRASLQDGDVRCAA
jgi:hypothetical protein